MNKTQPNITASSRDNLSKQVKFVDHILPLDEAEEPDFPEPDPEDPLPDADEPEDPLPEERLLADGNEEPLPEPDEDLLRPELMELMLSLLRFQNFQRCGAGAASSGDGSKIAITSTRQAWKRFKRSMEPSITMTII